MSATIKDFYGKDVASAIKEACETFGVAQENLTIEVVETGSTGIFGLIRKKAHIRASVQIEEAETTEEAKPKPTRKKKKKEPAAERSKAKGPASQSVEKTVPVEDDIDEEDDNDIGEQIQLSPDSLTIIKAELEQLIALMGCPSEVTVEDDGGSAKCRVDETYEDDLTGQDGRTLDSLQYILRKIVARKIPERVRLTIDVGNYRERRHQELRDKAIDYAALVKQNGKTQVIPALNPSERRVVHVALQDDSDIRSRSVGEGLFKKVLIYKPGKPKKNNGRRRSKGRPRKRSDAASGKDKQSNE